MATEGVAAREQNLGHDFKLWKKKKPNTLGYEMIYVLVDSKGDPVMPLSDRPNEVQCSTLDRIPFCMRRKALLEKYEAHS